MKRWISLLALIVLFAFALPQTSFAADDDEGISSLEKGEPIRHLMLLRSGRFEIQPLAMFGVNEPFYQTIGFGAELAYYFTNYLGLGASFVYNPLHLDNDEIKAVKQEGYSEKVTSTLAVAQANMNFDVGLYYAPMFGKFSVFGWILNYDFHIFGGFGAIIMGATCGAGGSDCKEAKNNNLEGPKFAGVMGLGVRLFMNNFVALNFEMKDYMTKYADFSRGPADDRERFQNFVVGTFGVSLFFPINVYMSK
ncbi:MAG: outer membrane beta-barrel domain-containing protein [Proteobacteria bacterium]|nr:outer membrane beta-barrel domain-containing protein [Pseudomonadota bacterium]